MAQSLLPSCELDLSTPGYQSISKGDHEKALMVTINDPEPDYIVCKEMTQNFKNCAEGLGMILNKKGEAKTRTILCETSILITSNAIPNQAGY